MSKAKYPATCLLCRAEFDKSIIWRHLSKCAANIEQGYIGNKKYKKRTLYLLRIQAKYNPFYWLYVEAQDQARVGDVDDLLRGIWLECCGHLSAFSWADTADQKDAWSLEEFIETGTGEYPNDVPMDATIQSVWKPKRNLQYQYDFGTTTDLTLRMVSQRSGLVKPKELVRVVARNHQPVVPCGNCGQPATVVSPEYSYDTSGWLCDACRTKSTVPDNADEDEYYDEQYFLPVLNSPRTGACGYNGSSLVHLGEPLPIYALPEEKEGED